MKPKLRFKNFNSDWINCTIKDVADVIGGGTPDTSNSKFWNGNINWFTPSEVGKSKYVSNSERKITELGVQKSSAKLLPIGAILLSSRATVGEASILEKNQACTNQGFQSLVAHKNIDTEFLYYLKDKYKREMLNKAFGSTFLEISKSNIEKIKIKIPSIEEQIKISNFLSLLDKKIELQTKKIEDLKLFKKGHNKYIFKNNNQRFTLKDLLIEYNNKTTINNEYEILSSTADGILFQNEYFNKQAASQDTTGYKIIPRGYITYRSMSDTGEFHFNEQNKVDFGIVSPAYPVFKINGNIVNEKYLLYYMNENKDFENQILSTKEGGTRFALSFTKLLSLNVNLPNKEEQNNFSKNIDTINKKIDLEKRKLDKLNNLKKGLMQNIFV